ncbi:hypothetical protein MKEN_01331400 [Mycena kentingensis (nom. inval.)]|nr:hypothetical protein MKEN_01331400 [Mycena kentingensis (nom. inval.)]
MSSSHPTITIDLVLDRHTTKDVLQGVLHAILFHRLFGLVKPQTFDVLDVTMPGVKDDEIEKLVNDKVEAFWRKVESGMQRRGQITVTFSEKKQRKTWFQSYDEEVAWEKWVVNAELRQPRSDRDQQQFLTTLAATLTKAVQTMLVHTSSEEGRLAVPPITDASGISPFPVNVVVSVGGEVVG